MKKLLLLILTFVFFGLTSQVLQAQNAPAIQWEKTIGGNKFDYLFAIEKTLDGNYLLGGWSFSDVSGDKSQPIQGGFDYWIVKVDTSGQKIWDKRYGGNQSDFLNSMQVTSDGGCILAGYTWSQLSGDKSEPAIHSVYGDIWVVKLDSLGNKQWDRTLGGLYYDHGNVIKQTSNGNFIVGGQSNSGIGGNKTSANNGGFDYWIVMLDGNGIKLWDKTFGGSGDEDLKAIQQTTDGGFVLGGTSSSGNNGDKTQASVGLSDYWLLKIDATGNKQWDKTFGGTVADSLYSLQQTFDGGFILGGTSKSGIGGDKSQVSNGDNDYWVIKTDAQGNKLWDETLGGSNRDELRVFQQTTDNGFILGGWSYSGIGGDKTEATKGMADYWLVKLNSQGNKDWDKTLGGTGDDMLFSLQQTQDDGYIFGGLSDSGIGGDKFQASKGMEDYWVVKLGPAAITGLSETQTTNLILYPNPTTGLINLELKDQKPTQISVYNSLGQIILTKTEAQPNQNGKLQLDLSNQAKGIYTIQLISGNQSSVKKVVLR